MVARVVKLDPRASNVSEEAVDLEYYLSLTPAERVRMAIERSILLIDIARRYGPDRSVAPLVKRR